MAPQTEVDDVVPGTLPADFFEEEEATPTTLPSDFFEESAAPPVSVTAQEAKAQEAKLRQAAAKPKPAPPVQRAAPSKARLVMEERPEPAVRKPAPAVRSVDDEPERKSKAVWIYGGVGVTAVAILVGALAMHNSKSSVQTVAAAKATVQPLTSSTQPQGAASGSPSVSSEKPSASTTLNAQSNSAADRTASTQTAPVTPAPVRADQMTAQLNAAPRIASSRNAGPDAPPSETIGMGLDSGNSAGGIGSLSKQSGVKVQLDKGRNVSAGVTGGVLIQTTKPVYPPIAKSARIAGTVTMQVTITKTGTVTGVHVISGPSALQQAAVDAVKNWRYKPFMLDNQPIEVQQSLSVNFQLGAN